jgi:hypothetical protein
MRTAVICYFGMIIAYGKDKWNSGKCRRRWELENYQL